MRNIIENDYDSEFNHHNQPIIEIIDAPRGSHLTVRIALCKKQNELIERLEKYNIGIYGVKQYYHDSRRAPEDIFLLGFNSLTKEEIPAACIKLNSALKEIYT